MLQLIAYDGHAATPISMAALRQRIRQAQVILIGEQHGHMAGHALQRQLMDDWATAGWISAVSLEMVTRDEQAAVDAYLAGQTSREQFVASIEGEQVSAQQRWVLRYQPLVDVARSKGLPVIAANAPRHLVKQARQMGATFDASLGPEERGQVVQPAFEPSAGYRQRFREAMQAHPMPDGQVMSQDMVDAMFTSQLIWDATMADSVAQAFDAFGPRIVHVVGQFHIAHDGGLVQALWQAAPDARVLTISLVPFPADEDDRGWKPGVSHVVIETSTPDLEPQP